MPYPVEKQGTSLQRRGGEGTGERIAMFNLCRPIMPSGAKCHTPALRGKPYCYYHTRLHRFPAAQASPSMASRSPRKTSSATHSSSPITTVESITHTDTGDELGPPERICDTPEDCATCAERDTCQDDDKAKD